MAIKIKRFLYKAILVLLLTILLSPSFFLPTNSFIAHADHATVEKVEPKVYITSYGELYHNENCGYLHHSKIAIGLYRAIDLGYSACSQCGGSSSGYITVEYYETTDSGCDTASVIVYIFLGAFFAFVFFVSKNYKSNNI